MKHALADAANDLTAAKLGAAASGIGMLLSWDASVAIVGVPINVLLAGMTGALLGVAYGDPLASRGRLLTVTLVNAFIAAAVAAILPHVPLFGWIGKASAAAVALVVGFFARWWVPALIERVPALIRAGAEKFGAKDGGKQ